MLASNSPPVTCVGRRANNNAPTTKFIPYVQNPVHRKSCVVYMLFIHEYIYIYEHSTIGVEGLS